MILSSAIKVLARVSRDFEALSHGDWEYVLREVLEIGELEDMELEAETIST